MNYIFYHNDLDGVFSAALVNIFLNTKDVMFYAMDYHSEVPSIPVDENDTVWIVDFSFPILNMVYYDNTGCKVKWFDHHATAMPVNEYEFKNVEKYFDLNRSGVGIVYDELFRTKRPIAINYIEDRDLWKFKFKDTNDFIEGLNVYYDMHPSKEYMKDIIYDENISNDIISKGKLLFQAKKFRVEKSLEQGKLGTFMGHPAFFVNATSDVSDIGNEACKMSTVPIVAVVYRYIEPDLIKVSLRSIFIDVSELAKKYGGGGHRLAAGFTITDKHSLFKRFNKGVVDIGSEY